MSRLILSLIVVLGLTSCFNETAYYTTYVLSTYEQQESGGDYISLVGAKSYVFEATTDEWEILSYDQAEMGVITNIETGEQKGPFSWSEPYDGDESKLSMQLDRESVMIVVVEPSSLTYAYTDYTVPINLEQMLVDIVFRTWKYGSYTASTWTFVSPEEVVEDEETEDEETEEEETEDETETDEQTETETE